MASLISRSPRTGSEQPALFGDDVLLPERLPSLDALQPAFNLFAVFEDCHNYIYANEGMLKDKIFHEMVKLLAMKLHDEQQGGSPLRFGVTAREYRDVAANRPADFLARLNELFHEVKRHYRGFAPEETLKLKPLTLAYIVNRLQFISLHETPGDIKGEAFQAFVNRHQRGDRGEFFTPHPIVRLAVEMIAPEPDEKIIDPACGSGGFLMQAVAHVREKFGIDANAYIRQCIRGIEFNPDVALSAMIRLAFEGGTGEEILCANALLPHEPLENAFDVVLTNPPFGNKGKIEDPHILQSYRLARKWNRVGERWEMSRIMLAAQSPDILFIEKSLALLRPGGRMAIVLPDGLLQNISSGYVRQWLRTQASVLGVVSIPQEAFVPYGTGIKTSLLLVQKLPASNRSCFMARIEKIGYDVKGQPVYRRNSVGSIERASDGTPVVEQDIDQIAADFKQFLHGHLEAPQSNSYALPLDMLNSRLDVGYYLPDDRQLLDALVQMGAKPLGELADILTEADDFRLDAESEIRYIAISDVDYRSMQVVSQQILKAHEAPSRATYRLLKGDIITAVSGASTGTPRHATALITEDEDGAICSNGFAVLRNIRGVEPLFLLAYMRTEYYLRQVRRLLTGHAIPALSAEDLSRVLVPLPPEQEQRTIARRMAEIQEMRRAALRATEHLVAETTRLIQTFD